MNPALVVVPTYNERENISPLVRAVLAADPRVDVLVVDDNSPDGTGQVADEIARSEPRVRVLHRSAKDGLGRAYLEAFARALGEQHAAQEMGRAANAKKNESDTPLALGPGAA